MFKDESHQKEIDYGGNSHYKYRGQRFVHSNPQEELQQDDMHTVVDSMSTSKSYTLFDCCFTMKCKPARKIKITEPTKDITNSISDAYIYEVIKNKINNIMDNCSNDTNNCKASELSLFVVLMQKSNYIIYQFLDHLSYKHLSSFLASLPSIH